MSRKHALSAAFAAAALAFAAPASAETFQAAGNQSLCFDISSGQAQLAPCSGGYGQDFDIPDGGYLRLDNNNCVAATGEGGALVIDRCRKRYEQYWTYDDRSGELISDSGLCADVEGAKIRNGRRIIGYRCTGNSNQSWVAGYSGGDDYPGDDYGRQVTALLSPQHAQGMCLDVRNKGSDLLIYGCHGKSNQQFTFSSGGQGQITVAGYCLTAGGQNQPVFITQCTNSNALYWTMPGDGTIRNANGFCLDVNGGSKKSGTAVIVYKCSGKSNQRWSVLER